MLHREDESWLYTATGDSRGYIQPECLQELWFHTGTNCNLRCPFCLEGSKPGDDRLAFITLDDARPFIDEALTLGVEKFSFTGGEPFVNPHMVGILAYALDDRPCLVLTNATEPLQNQFAEIRLLIEKPNPLSFRVSLDYPDPEKHDSGRGKGNFRLSLWTLSALNNAGFGVSIARLRDIDENTETVDSQYRPYFEEAGLPADTRIVSFPDFMTPGSLPDVPQITENCMKTYLTAEQRSEFMCNFSKMIVKRNGRTGVYACTLVDDDGNYNLGATLTESMKVRVMLRHHRCYSCFAYGATCSER